MEEEIIIVIKPRRQATVMVGVGAVQVSQQVGILGERNDGIVRSFTSPAQAVRFLATRIAPSED